MPAIFDKLFFIGPMSLGDAFVSSGIVNYYADRCIELHYPVESKRFNTLSTLFQDQTNIKVISLDSIESENEYVREHRLSRLMRIDFESHKIRNFNIVPMWDLQLYNNYDVPFSFRYTHFRLPKHIEGSEELYQELSQGEPYILVHRYTNDHPDGISIDIPGFRKSCNLPDLRIIEIHEGITDNMMHYVKLIQNAQEIHVVPSSFHCLVDSMDTNASLYFHDIRERTSMNINSKWNKKYWTVVNYSQRI